MMLCLVYESTTTNQSKHNSAFGSVVLERSFIKNDDHVITIIVIVMLLNGDFHDDKRMLMLIKLTVLIYKKTAHYKKNRGCETSSEFQC